MEKINKVLKLFFSNKLTLVMLVAFAASMGYATFLENDFGTSAARAVVYDAWWFELLMLGLGINFIGNIFRYRLLQRKKLPILLFHIAFIVILLGAAITRYTSTEGLMRIREGTSSNILISQQQFLNIIVAGKNDTVFYEKPLKVSALTPPDFDITIPSGNEEIRFKTTGFTPDAEEVLVDDENGTTLLQLVTTSSSGRNDYYLKSGETFKTGSVDISFENQVPGAINIYKDEDQYLVHSPTKLDYIVMASQQVGSVMPDTAVVFKTRALYNTPGFSFVVAAIHEDTRVGYQTTEDKEAAKTLPDILTVQVGTKGNEIRKEARLSAAEGVVSMPIRMQVADAVITMSYGPKPIELPFSIKLDDFQLERYPGSTSPSSYASEVQVLDQNSSYPYRIYMNNVLDHGGYRFFQASYDTDERGTVLSVNKDWWGTRITYLGYFLMGLGMFISLFGRGSRFYEVNFKLKKLKTSAALLAILLFSPFYSSADDSNTETPENNQLTEVVQVDELLLLQWIDKSHATDFGKLLVQDLDGRIKPINTLASEFVRKIRRQLSFKYGNGENKVEMDCNQVFLSIHADPVAWQYIPFIKIDAEKGRDIFYQLEKEPTKYVSFKDFLDDEGNYKLSRAVDIVNRKKPGERNELDKEILKVDERFNIMFQALSGNYLRVFPKENDELNTWYTYQFQLAGFSPEDSIFVKGIIPRYFHSIQEARKVNDWSEPAENLAYIQTFQSVLGKKVSPSENRVKAELFYNKINLFVKLFPFFWVIGLGMLLVTLTKVFVGSKPWLERLKQIGVVLSWIGFILLTANMIVRWYAGGHAPWSNGYEMTILVAWAIMLFGILFSGRSDFVIPLAGLFTGTLLFVSFLDWLNPEITNLVPVLKSYWLKIHVAIIVSSYAPLALSAILGFTAMWLMISKRVNQNPDVDKSIKELTYINELSMTIGLFMLALGTFLGGVWANESWGRYWGWDPKETWALISIILYAAVLHLRLVPALRGAYTFNLASVVAFGSIIMTSFGVNYYLAGLHSYAKGDPLPVPSFIYWLIAIVGLTAIAAYLTEKQNLNVKSKQNMQ